MIRVIYNGIEKCDFVYYLSMILALKAPRVVVNDVSKTHDLFNSVSHFSDDNECTFKNVVFVKELSEEDSRFNEDDIYIEYRGTTVKMPEVENLREDTFHLVMPTYTAISLKLIENTVCEGTPLYILRDRVSDKVTDNSVAMMFGLKKDDIAGHLELNEADESAYVALTHNGKQRFLKASDDMQVALSYVVSVIFGMKEKDAKKLLKTANAKIK